MAFVLPIAYMRLWDVIVHVSGTVYNVVVESGRMVVGFLNYLFDDCFNDMGTAYNRAVQG